MAFGKPIFFYDNLLKKYAVTMTSEDPDYPKENLYDDWLQSLCKPTGSGDLRISFDAGVAVSVDIFTLGNVHNLKTVNATVKFQYSSTGAWAGEESDAFTGFVPATDDSYQYKLFTPISERYWSILLSGMTGIPQIGEASVGARYTLPWHFSGGHDRERHIKGTTNEADGGQKEDIIFYRRNVFPCRLADVQNNSQEETDFIAFMDAVEDGMPFWFLRDLSGAYELYFVSMKERIHKSPISDDGYRDFSFTLEEEI